MAVVPLFALLVEVRETWLVLIGSAIFGLAFYACAFQGILGPWNGAFGGMWILLAICFTFFHVGVCWLAYHLRRRNRIGFWCCLPFGIVACEFIRHLVTKLYDGCGLTFALLGQGLVQNNLLRQVADLGGVWVLSFVVSSLSSAGACWLDRDISNWLRFGLLYYACAILGLTVLYGQVRLSQYQPEIIGTVIVVPHQLTEAILSEVEASRLATTSKSGEWLCVVSPETSMTWSEVTQSGSEQTSTLQFLLKDMSAHIGCLAVIGVWISSESSSLRNSAIILDSGNVVTIVDKQHLVPGVEGMLMGTQLFTRLGFIPAGILQDVSPAIKPDFVFWRDRPLPVVPSVCYDLFFPGTFSDFQILDNSAIVCCLNESFDATGVCKQLSLVHTRLRAVEFRVPVVRSSLGGTSGVFDGNGNIVAPSEVRTNFSTYRVPGDTRVSFYMRFGDWFPKLCCVITATIFVVAFLLLQRDAFDALKIASKNCA